MAIPSSKTDIEDWGVQENAVCVRAGWLPGPNGGQHYQKEIHGAWPARTAGIAELVASSKPGKVFC